MAVHPDHDPEFEELRRAMLEMTEEEFIELLDGLPEPVAVAFAQYSATFDSTMPKTPLAQAQELNPNYAARPHLEYLSERIAAAVEEVKAGKSRKIAVSMPPRSGKSELISNHLPVWLLRQVPTWKIALMSYSPNLAITWSRSVRRAIEQDGARLGLAVAPDAGAVGDWETTSGGEVHARSMGQGLTGFGANVMIIDDPVKDFATAHNEDARDTLWQKWTSDIQTRLEPPNLTIVVQTRWHEDDFTGRLLDPKINANADEWEVISFPAIAVEDDVLGREPGDPLFPPLLPMEREVALKWWRDLERGLSTYEWAALYQQSPAPAAGAIFHTDWWRYWTTMPELVSRDPDTGEPTGKCVMLPDMSGARLIDSWDLNFDDTENSDFVVGQRWGRLDAYRYLLAQVRGRWNFPETLEQFKAFNADGKVHEHLVEKKANGAAMISSLAGKFAGIKPVNPTASKEVRARTVVAEIQSGNVLLPHPVEHPWVQDLLSELRSFPSGKHDDQVDALTQALNEMRDFNDAGVGVSIPSQVSNAPIRRAYGAPGGAARAVGAPSSGALSPLLASRIERRSGGARR